ncbi:hypothetical protein HQ585_06290, partial [candidate division KSB1 bacterium]|nr:hypothetical protein [candidate division KSB1 bacterium]
MQKANGNSTQKMIDLLDKKLLGYSLAAGAVIAGGDAHAEVQWSEPVNASVSIVAPYTVVFTGAGASATLQNMYIFGSGRVFAGLNAQIAINGPPNVAGFYSLSQQIGPSLLFLDPWGSFRYFPPEPAYIGVQLNLGTNTHYAWIGITLIPYTSLTVHDWAWEDSPGVPILAGETETSLSVSLTSFMAQMESGAVVLAWTTQSEVDNLGFALERCDMDGEGNVLSDWVEIASYLTHPELSGQGNTSETSEYKISDSNVETGRFYGYRLIDVDAAGNRQVHNLIQVEVLSTMPEGMVLLQNFPNPFNPTTTIEFSIPEQ